MSEIGSNPVERKAYVGMLIECPQCGQKMILHVGLLGDPKNNSIECIGCHHKIIPLVPGPIVNGPYEV